MKSAAAVVHSLRSPFVVEEIELPDLQQTDVLVRIVAVGICHTDIASRDGHLPAPFPAIFGHEGAGVVERVGKQVRKVAPGDHVVLAPDSDGTCERCASGEPTYCEKFLELNFQQGANGRTAQLADGRRASIKYFGQSSFAHYAVAGERSVVKSRKDVPLKLLGPLGCSMQTGAETVMNGLRPSIGGTDEDFYSQAPHSLGTGHLLRRHCRRDDPVPTQRDWSGESEPSVAAEHRREA